MKDMFEEFGRFGRPGPGFKGGFRAGRGMMEPAILGALSTKAMHGYEVISYLEEQSNGIWRPSAGSVYPTLQLLEEKGFVSGKEVDGKKVFILTKDGKKESERFEEMRNHMKEHFSHRFKGMHESRQQFGEIIRSIREIYRRGSDDQKSKLADAVTSFQNEVKRIETEEKS